MENSPRLLYTISSACWRLVGILLVAKLPGGEVSRTREKSDLPRQQIQNDGQLFSDVG